MLSFPKKAPVLLTSALTAAISLHGIVRAQNPAPTVNAGVAQSPVPAAVPYYGAPDVRFLPPLPVVPLAPLFVPPGLPVFAPPTLPPPWFAPLPLLDLTRQPIDEGTLHTQERAVTDAQGTRLLIRERTWKSAGIPCHELTVLQPATAAPAEQPTVPPAVEPAAAPPTTEPATTAPAAAPQPALAPIADAAAPQVPADRVPEPAPPTTTPSTAAPSTAVANPVVAPPAKESVKVYQYLQSGLKGIYSSIQAPRGERNLVGIGVSSDSTDGTRLYRYYQGQPAVEARDAKAQ